MFKTKIYTLAFLLGSFLMFSCSSDDDALAKKLVIDGESSVITNGYIDGFGTDFDDNNERVSTYGIVFTTGTLEFTDGLTGTGNYLFLYVASPSAIELKSGTYTINTGETFYKSDAFAFAAEGVNTESGIGYQAKSGTAKISKSGTTFKITFNMVMQKYVGEVPVDVTVKGSYEGKLEEISLGF